MNMFYWIAVAAVTVLSSARLTRLIVHDDFPPTVWLKGLWIAALDGGPRRREWQTLPLCHYCTSFWTTLLIALSGYFSDWHTVWWLTCGIFAASYLTAVFVDRDVNRG